MQSLRSLAMAHMNKYGELQSNCSIVDGLYWKSYEDGSERCTTDDELCSYAVKIAQASNWNKDYDCGDSVKCYDSSDLKDPENRNHITITLVWRNAHRTHKELKTWQTPLQAFPVKIPTKSYPTKCEAQRSLRWLKNWNPPPRSICSITDGLQCKPYSIKCTKRSIRIRRQGIS